VCACVRMCVYVHVSVCVRAYVCVGVSVYANVCGEGGQGGGGACVCGYVQHMLYSLQAHARTYRIPDAHFNVSDMFQTTPFSTLLKHALSRSFA